MNIIEKLGITPIESHAVRNGFVSDTVLVRILEQQNNELLEAFIEFVQQYIELVESGDCGFWDPYEEGKVVIAIKAIEKACYPKKWKEIKELLK